MTPAELDALERRTIESLQRYDFDPFSMTTSSDVARCCKNQHDAIAQLRANLAAKDAEAEANGLLLLQQACKAAEADAAALRAERDAWRERALGETK